MKYLLKTFVFLSFVFLFFLLYKITPLEYKKINFQFFNMPGKKPASFSSEEGKKVSLFLEKQKGRSIWSLRLKDMAREIQNVFPSKEIYLKRKFPNKIKIFIKESLPVLLLLTESGRFYPVFHEGKIGMALTADELLDLPIVRGNIFKKDKNLRVRILNLLKILPKEDIFSPGNISEIIYKSKQESFMLYLIPHHFILEMKHPWKNKTIENINFVLNYLIQKDEKASVIDAGFPEKIIVRRKRDDF